MIFLTQEDEKGLGARMTFSNKLTTSLFLLLIVIAFFAPLGYAETPTVSQTDLAMVKTHADAFNQSRNYQTRFGPAEYVCWTQGTFLAYQPCHDIPTCTQTANLVCSVNGQQGCMLDVLAIHILDYKNGVDKLNAAYSLFLNGYNSFASNKANSLNTMNNAFDAMKSAADVVSHSKLRYPEKISCACTQTIDCCLGLCPEAHFNYTAIAAGKQKISDIRTKACADGTPGGQCSANKPQECIIGELMDNSARCGCPLGMRALPDGKGCEFIPCMDNGTSVPGQTCSSKTIGKKCENGVLVDKASECGCPTGQAAAGNTCICPAATSQVCNTTNVTKYHMVTYLFDRGGQKVVNESYTFERKTCYPVQQKFVGKDCSQLNKSIVNNTPSFVSPDPPQATVKQVACSRCPSVCTRNPPVGLQCGSCSCPPNLGFCGSTQLRVEVKGTMAYCAKELLQPQKEDGAACANGFECETNSCRDKVCYNRQNDPIQLFIDWVNSLLGFKSAGG